MNPLRTPERGETVKLGPPAAGDVVITVDPSAAGTAFAAGLQTFLPGAQLPVHRHRDRDVVLFVSKGQGRLTLEGRVVNVVPGAMLHVPRNTWVGVRNTGTGVLQLAWASSPGLEAWFRDLARLGGAASSAALHELGQRHHIEFHPSGDAPASAPDGPRRSRRGGRRHRRADGPAPSGASVAGATPAPVPIAPSPAPPGPATPSASGGRRRRHRRGRRGRAHSASPGGSPAQGSSSAPTVKASPPAPGRPRSGRGHHRRRVKEVYMGGRWVKVEGEGPVIAPGRSSEPRGSKPGEDDEPPPIRLSVPL